jgi:adenine deaminase
MFLAWSVAGRGSHLDSVIFANAMVFDGVEAELRERHVLIEGDRIKEIRESPIRSDGARVIDIRGRTLMPGLIDAHVHAYYPLVYATQGNRLPITINGAHGWRRKTSTLSVSFRRRRPI